jgi:FHA domain
VSKTQNNSGDPQTVDPKPNIDAQVTQEAPSVQEEKSIAEKSQETTKELGSRRDISEHDAPTQPSKKEHGSDYYRTYIMDRDNVLHRMLSVPQTRELRAPFDVKRVTLHIRGMKEHIVLTEERVVIVGRADLRQDGFKPDIDLTPYGGRERGVSRAHIRLHVQGGKLFMTDLYSANGTFMGGERLTAEKMYELHNGDELLLGALGIRVEIAE